MCVPRLFNAVVKATKLCHRLAKGYLLGKKAKGAQYKKLVAPEQKGPPTNIQPVLNQYQANSESILANT